MHTRFTKESGLDAIVNIRILAALVALAGATLTRTAAAQAEPQAAAYEFGDPAKNIWCSLRLYPDGENTAQCDIDKHDFAGPEADATGPCPQTEGYIFMLRETDAPQIHCLHGSVLGTIYYVLDNGQSRTAGAITCDSQPSGIKCTNSQTGHYFRLSRSSYEVG